MEIQHILIIIWIILSISCGIAEAFYFSKKKSYVELMNINIHYWFTLIRSIFAAPMVLIIFFKVGFLESLIFSTIMMLIFPFFHDGSYYTTRELIKKGTYKKTWFDQSKTTDALLSFNTFWRIVFIIIALLIYPY